MSAGTEKPDPAGAPARERRALAVFDRLLHLYPPSHRRRFGASMVASFEAEYESARQRRGPYLVLFWAATVWHMAVSAVSEWHAWARSAVPHRGRTGWRGWGPATELRAAAKSVRRSPRTSIAAVLCIGLGTSATSAVLTLYAATILRPLPFPDADRLVRVWMDERGVGDREPLALPDVEDLRAQASGLDPLVAAGRSRIMFTEEGGVRRVEGEAVTDGYFELLGVRPLLGRLFTSREYRQGSDPVMMLSHRTWADRYAADPSVVGSTVRTALREYTVVGVAPAGFPGTIEDDFPDIEYWVPVVHDRTEEERRSRNTTYLWTLGRLDRGASLETTAEEVRLVGERIARLSPDSRAAITFRVERMGENWREGLRGRGLALLAAAGLLLLVAATNTAALLVARSIDNRGRMAVRAALGATRPRLVRFVLAETLILTSVGALVGALFAAPVLRAFLRLAPEEVPMYVAVQPDARALLLCGGVLVLAALLAGVLPALVGTRIGPAAALGSRTPAPGRRERKLGEAVIVAEIALTLTLTVGAGLLLRSYQSLRDRDLGYRTDRVLRMAIFVDEADVDRDEALPNLYDRIRTQLRSHPGVERVGLVAPTLPPGTGGDTRLEWRGMPADAHEHGVPAFQHRVDQEFLRTMEIPIVAGRALESGDAAEPSAAAVVSESVAGLMGGSEGALGRELAVGGTAYRIVGVARDVMYFGPVAVRARDLDVYTPLAGSPARRVSIAIATRTHPSELIAPMRERLNAIAPRSALDWVDPLTVAIGGHFQGPRFYLALFGAFAASALGLTAVGLFAALAHLVAGRRRELGVRMALGADSASLVRRVLVRGLAITGLGLAIGSGGALVAGRLLRGMLSDVSAYDPVTLGGAALVIGAVAALASVLPALRAGRVSPAAALRSS